MCCYPPCCLFIASLISLTCSSRGRQLEERNGDPHRSRRQPPLPGSATTHRKPADLPGEECRLLLANAGTRWLTTHWDGCCAHIVHLDSMAVWFALGITAMAGVLAGLLPAISASGGSVLSALQENSRGIGGSASRTSMRKALLTGEVALTVVLLVAAGLLFRSFLRLRGVDLGCTTKNVLTMNYFLRGDKYSKPEQIVNFDTQLLEVRHIPGVQAADSRTLCRVMATMAITNSGFPSIRLSRLENITSPRTTVIRLFLNPSNSPSGGFFLRMSGWSTTNTRS